MLCLVEMSSFLFLQETHFILEVECRKHILKMLKMKPEDRGDTVREFMMTGSSSTLGSDM